MSFLVDRLRAAIDTPESFDITGLLDEAQVELQSLEESLEELREHHETMVDALCQIADCPDDKRFVGAQETATTLADEARKALGLEMWGTLAHWKTEFSNGARARYDEVTP